MTSSKGGAKTHDIPHTRLEDENMIWETYEMGQKLGQGSFGKVYQVKHKETNEQWAMKIVNKEKAGGSAIKLLEREVNILKRVIHNNIIKLNEVFDTSKRMFLVMELCEGGELADVLKEKKFFVESEVKVITKELASAIAYLHKNDIVHRDLKLENILISKFPDATNPEDRLQIKVTDFGLSIEKSGVGHDNMMQDFCGTPNYMAPEIIDNKTYSQQCDVWALGVIVYTLFSGYPPFRSNDDDSLYDIIKKGELDFSDDVWDEVSEEAKTCIRKMLNTDPAHRLTASEVLNHHWITGNQEQHGANVLELMKEWGRDLRLNDHTDDDSENSAINGELEPHDTENHSGETNNNEPKDGVESKEERKGSGGRKSTNLEVKPTARHHQNRNSTGSIPRTSTNSSLKSLGVNQKTSGSKSPMPASKAGQSATTSTRPNTQKESRTTPVNSNKIATTTTTTTKNVPRPVSKAKK